MWLSRIARRRASSIAAATDLPFAERSRVTVSRWLEMPGTGNTSPRRRPTPAVPLIRPVSPTWPPGFGVERGQVEDDFAGFPFSESRGRGRRP